MKISINACLDRRQVCREAGIPTRQRNEEDIKMRTELEQLKQAGCDIDGALERFLQDEEFYLECYE